MLGLLLAPSIVVAVTFERIFFRGIACYRVAAGLPHSTFIMVHQYRLSVGRHCGASASFAGIDVMVRR